MSDRPYIIEAEGFQMAAFATYEEARHFMATSPIFKRPGRVARIVHEREIEKPLKPAPTAWERIMDDDPAV